MNVNLNWSATLQTTVVVEDSILPNTYEIQFDLITNTEIPEEQFIYFNRLRWFVEAKLHLSTIINNASPLFHNLSAFDQTIMQVSDRPSELLIAAILSQKASAIMDGKLIVNEITLGSSLGEYIRYTITHEDIIDAAELFPWIKSGEKVWWRRGDTSINDIDSTIIPWEELNLTTEKKKMADVKKFTPTIITGGKDNEE